MDILNRALLRKSKEAVGSLLAFYKDNRICDQLKFTEVILEASIYLEDFEMFKEILQNYEGNLPQVCLQSVIYQNNERMLEALLNHFSEQFLNPDCYCDVSSLPSEFTKIMDKDMLKDYSYFEKISHPIFCDPQVFKDYWNYDPLQMAVLKDNSRMVKLLLDKTLYKASTPLRNGDNIIHLMVKDKFGDSFILQKLLERLEQEVGSAEIVKKDFLMAKSESDGLSVIEYCTGSKVHAPIIFKYSSVAGLPEDDMYSQSTVLDVDILHDMTLQEEAKLDKKQLAESIKKIARQKYKDLIKNTEMLAKKPQFVFGYAQELGLNLSGNCFTCKV